jgi:Amidase
MTGRDHIEAALDRARETAELNAFVTIADETAVRAPRATGGPLDTDPTAFASLPSISVPAGLTASGLPVGLSFDGLPGTDTALLALAAAFERPGPPLSPDP